MRISDWSSDVCSSDLRLIELLRHILRLFVKIALQLERERNGAAMVRLETLGRVHGDRDDLFRGGVGDFLNVHAAFGGGDNGDPAGRSEEHTSELQSLMRISYAVFCLKQKKYNEN